MITKVRSFARNVRQAIPFLRMASVVQPELSLSEVPAQAVAALATSLSASSMPTSEQTKPIHVTTLQSSNEGLRSLCRIPNDEEIREIATRAAIADLGLENVIKALEAAFQAEREREHHALTTQEEQQKIRVENLKVIRAETAAARAAAVAARKLRSDAATTLVDVTARVRAQAEKQVKLLAAELARKTEERDEAAQVAAAGELKLRQARFQDAIAMLRTERESKERQFNVHREHLQLIHSLGLYQWPARIQLFAAVFSIPGLIAVLATLRGYDPADTGALFSRSAVTLAGVGAALGLLLGGWLWHRFSLGRALSSAAAGLFIVASWILLGFAGGPSLLLCASLILLSLAIGIAGLPVILSMNGGWPQRVRTTFLVFAVPTIAVFSLISSSPIAIAVSAVTGVVLSVCCFGAGAWALSTNHHLRSDDTTVLKVANKLDQWVAEAGRDLVAAAVTESADLWASVHAALLGLRPEEAIHIVAGSDPTVNIPYSPELHDCIRHRETAEVEARQVEQLYTERSAEERAFSASLAELEAEVRNGEMDLGQARLQSREHVSALDVAWQNARIHAEQAFHLAKTALNGAPERFPRLRNRRFVA